MLFKLFTLIKALLITLFAVIAPMNTGAMNHGIQDKPGRYTLELGYADTKVSTAGSSEYVLFPTMVSIYFERIETIACSIHINIGESGVEEKRYNFGTAYKNGSGIVCTRDDDFAKERIASFNGVLEVTGVTHDRISGSFEADLTGAISGVAYTLKGNFVSANQRL